MAGKTKEGPSLSTTFVCPECGNEWVDTKHFSTVGLTCPKCGNHDPDFSWLEHAMRAKDEGRLE